MVPHEIGARQWDGSLDKFVDGILRLDANSPLSYILTRASLQIFGDSSLSDVQKQYVTSFSNQSRRPIAGAVAAE